jgi:hypothetical protein
MIIDNILQVILILLLLLLPGFLWARILFPEKWLREQLSLAPGLSLAILIPVSFLIWGPLEVSVDAWGSFLIFLCCSLPPVLILTIKNMSWPKTLVPCVTSLNCYKTALGRIRTEMRREHVILLLAIIFAVILNFQPHFSYLHPLHTDEWHYVIRAQDLGNSRSYLDWAKTYPETGYLSLLALLHSFSGISLFDLALALPALILSYAFVLFYMLGRKFGPGHVIIFPLLLIPSTVRYLGPVLLVPVALFLVTFPLALLIIQNKRIGTILFLPFPIICQLLVHPPTAIALLVVILVSSVLVFKNDKKQGAMLLGILGLVAFLAFLPFELWVNRLKWNVITEQGSFFLKPPSITGYLDIIGIMMLFLAALGAVEIIKKKSQIGIIALISSVLLIIILMIFVIVFPEFNNVTALHDRILFCLIVVLVIPAGYGIAGIGHVDGRLAFATIAVLMIVSTSIHIQTDYYHIASEREYDDFVWISENLNESYKKAVLDPWKAIPFKAVTGKNVYYSWPQGPASGHQAKVDRVSLFFDNACQDTSFLVANKISIVYTAGPCSNPDLIKVHDRVYVLSL